MKLNSIWLLVARIVCYFALVCTILYMGYTSPYNPHPESAADIRQWVLGFGALAPLIYLVVYTIRPVLFFPTLLLNLSAGILFGPALGIVMVLVGGLGCATFCYLLGRYGGGHWLLSTFGGKWGDKLTRYLVGEGSFTKMLWLRTVPIFPYDPISIIAGSVKLPYRIFSLGTLIGMLPGAIAYNLLSDSFGTPKFYAAIGITIIAFGVPLLLWQRQGGAGMFNIQLPRMFHWKEKKEDDAE